MFNRFYYDLEQLEKGSELDLQSMIAELSFNGDGLIPVITQCAESSEVLMMAWMNIQALEHTLATGCVTYWSRSRQQLWVKGETSGHTQALTELRFDCDGDTLLCKVRQTGKACHTGRDSCFYFSLNPEKGRVTVLTDPG